MGGLCDSLHFWRLNLRACSRPICIVHGNDFGDVHALRLTREPRKCDSPKWEEWGGGGGRAQSCHELDLLGSLHRLALPVGFTRSTRRNCVVKNDEACRPLPVYNMWVMLTPTHVFHGWRLRGQCCSHAYVSFLVPRLKTEACDPQKSSHNTMLRRRTLATTTASHRNTQQSIKILQATKKTSIINKNLIGQVRGKYRQKPSKAVKSRQF